LGKGEQLDLNFSFGVIKAKVQWVSKKFIGLAFAEESPNLFEVRRFIRSRFGVAYA